ncbi:MAG: hypothetical protein ACK4WD_02205 [Flavobacteriales bacterium]|jgi:hypothetical protein
MKNLILLLFVPFSVIAGGDPPLAIFKTIGTSNVEEGIDIAIDSNGFIYALSSTNAAPSSHTDVVLTCMDQNLNCLWSEVYGTGAIEQPSAIAINSANEIFISGTQLHVGDDGYDVFVMTIAADGTQLSYASHSAPSWQVAHQMTLLNERPLLLIEDYSSADRYKLLQCNVGDVFEYLPLGTALSGRIPSAIEVVGQEIYLASYLENESNEEAFLNDSKILKLNSATFSESNLSVSDIQGNVVINDIFIDSEGLVHIAGEIDLLDYVSGYYARYDNEGNLLMTGGIGATDDFGFSNVYVTADNIILPGYLKFAGAGKKDAFVMMLENDGTFAGAPTFGGEEDDFFVNAVFSDSGEIYCVGTSYSFNGETGETIVLKLSEASAGGYVQTFDLNNECLVVSIQESKQLPREIIREEYFDLMGRKMESTNIQQIYLKVMYYDNGDVEVSKRLDSFFPID